MRADAPVLGVDRDDDGLAPEQRCELLDELRPRERGRLMLTLSAPASSDRGRVPTVLMPPPNVNGSRPLGDRAASSAEMRDSTVATTSRNTSSSAPASE